jgi:hypothetical protein
MSARQCECGKHRQKRKVSIDDVKGDIAAKYRDLGIVRGESGKWKETVRCYKLCQNISTSERAHQDMMKGITPALSSPSEEPRRRELGLRQKDSTCHLLAKLLALKYRKGYYKLVQNIKPPLAGSNDLFYCIRNLSIRM